jgi:hypothetical protein
MKPSDEQVPGESATCRPSNSSAGALIVASSTALAKLVFAYEAAGSRRRKEWQSTLQGTTLLQCQHRLIISRELRGARRPDPGPGAVVGRLARVPPGTSAPRAMSLDPVVAAARLRILRSRGVSKHKCRSSCRRLWVAGRQQLVRSARQRGRCLSGLGAPQADLVGARPSKVGGGRG